MLNVGNNPLKFRKAELERKPALIFGRINNLECHTSPKHSLSTFAACSCQSEAIGTLRHLSRVGDHLVGYSNKFFIADILRGISQRPIPDLPMAVERHSASMVYIC